MSDTADVRPSLDTEAVDQLDAALRGRLIRPADDDYDERRAVYNAMIDRRPELIARCVDAGDVITAVNFARTHGIDVAVRGGAHNGPGLGTCDGLVIDLEEMHGVRVDPKSRTATVEGGAEVGAVDHATEAFGLAAPFGIISTTGVGGLTLGGGIGHLSRKFGLSVDNLVSADVVLADGSFVTASADSEPELFWALRGGGGNFGVVTSFTFQLHPLGQVITGPTLWPLDRTAEVMRFYREFLPAAPEELNGFFAFLTVPPVPQFPTELHMQKMCGVVWCYTGDHERFDEVFAPVRALEPALDGMATMPFSMIQSAFDGLYPEGDQWYWRADFFRELTDDCIAQHVEHGSALPTWKSTMHLYPIDGAVHRVAENETAFAYRDVVWAQVIAGVDPDPANADALRDWAVAYSEAVHEFSAGGAYVNMIMNEGHDRVVAAYRGNYDRLARVKATYDPGNLFHINQNIPPTGGAIPEPRVQEAAGATEPAPG